MFWVSHLYTHAPLRFRHPPNLDLRPPLLSTRPRAHKPTRHPDAAARTPSTRLRITTLPARAVPLIHMPRLPRYTVLFREIRLRYRFECGTHGQRFPAADSIPSTPHQCLALIEPFQTSPQRGERQAPTASSLDPAHADQGREGPHERAEWDGGRYIPGHLVLPENPEVTEKWVSPGLVDAHSHLAPILSSRQAFLIKLRPSAERSTSSMILEPPLTLHVNNMHAHFNDTTPQHKLEEKLCAPADDTKEIILLLDGNARTQSEKAAGDLVRMSPDQKPVSNRGRRMLSTWKRSQLVILH
ncbi:hypothetical protein DFH09DRAFT_1293016 [Mycena vulgaris]|nr:hypothetical protein DFH09DRAFT_1293016 [Mycena vulgaris]